MHEDFDGFAPDVVRRSIRGIIRDFCKRRAPKEVIQNLRTLLKSCKYMDAISLSIDYACGRFEEDDKLILHLCRICGILKCDKVIGHHQNYMDW